MEGKNTQAEKIAVFFDAENIDARHVQSILTELEARGEILFRRAYADWSLSGKKSSWQKQITKTPITVYHQFHNDDTQVIDKLIIMDAVELAVKHAEVTTIAIIASDNGYYSLALRLRELGRKVIGIGEKKKCRPIWVNSCNEFKYIEDLMQIKEEILEDNTNKSIALKEFFDQAYNATPKIEGKDAVLTSRLGVSILRFKSDFSYKDYGATGLNDFIEKYLQNDYKIYSDGNTPPAHIVEKLEKTGKS